MHKNGLQTFTRALRLTSRLIRLVFDQGQGHQIGDRLGEQSMLGRPEHMRANLLQTKDPLQFATNVDRRIQSGGNCMLKKIPHTEFGCGRMQIGLIGDNRNLLAQSPKIGRVLTFPQSFAAAVQPGAQLEQFKTTQFTLSVCQCPDADPLDTGHPGGRFGQDAERHIK